MRLFDLSLFYMKNKLIVIAGTNASGKSGLGIELAGKYNAEIVSADSRQVFKGLDLGSGKVTKEEMKGIPHHLIDVAEPNDFFALPDFQKMAYEAIDNIISRGKTAFLVGGTGLYVNSVVDGYNIGGDKPDMELRKKLSEMSIDELMAVLKQKSPDVLSRIDIKNKMRLERAAERAIKGTDNDRPSCPKYETLVLGVTWPREILYERIRQRLDMRLKCGMIDEVSKLRSEGATDEFLYRLGLEYRYILMYLRGEFPDFDSFYNKLFMEIRHLAKEQMTWFRKRQDIIWLNCADDPYSEAAELIGAFLKNEKDS